MNIIAYIEEEVKRQGHDVKVQDGLSRVAFMLNAWVFALNLKEVGDKSLKLSIADVETFGMMIEPEANYNGFRTCDVWVGSKLCPPPERIKPQLEFLWESINFYTPIEFYQMFENIHPFRDGNGRTGKIILNWLNGTLLDPIFPPKNLWGREIENP